MDRPALTGEPAHRPEPSSAPSLVRGLWYRQLPHYPDGRPRMVYLGIVVVTTVVLYYELYAQFSVAPTIIADFHMTFTYYVYVAVIGNAVGAFASLLAGLADRWGRANLVAYGLLFTGLLTAVGIPNAPDKVTFTVLVAGLNFVEGIILVATPALIRDFSPQLGRATAMGFWTLGPVIGSLVVTTVSSHTLASHPDWQFQLRVAGVAGLVVFLVALFGLRELSPRLRDQLMVSMRDRALIEARAAGLDPTRALAHQWRSMLRRDVIGSAVAISLFLVFYYSAVGSFVVYFSTTFGYSNARANSLANWYWAANAITLVVAGLLSDRLKVRKPLIVVGGIVSIIGLSLFAARGTHPDTGYYTFAWITMLTAIGGGVAYCAWMASFTETVEAHNPAATATGLAVWGWIIRITVSVSSIALTLVVSAVTPLVDQGPQVQALSARYATQLTTIAAVDPATLAALQADPTDQAAGVRAVGEIVARQGVSVPEAAARLAAVGQVPPADLAFLRKNGPTVARAAANGPHQWQRWWWVCVICQILFLPCVFIMAGRWSPRRARQDARDHEDMVERELQAIAAGAPGAPGAPGTPGQSTHDTTT